MQVFIYNNIQIEQMSHNTEKNADITNVYVQISRISLSSDRAHVAKELNPLSAKSPGTTAQHPFECLPKFRREHCVNHGVEGAVEVSEPQKHTCHELGRLTAVARGLQQSDQEERQPAGDEGTGDDRQGFGRLTLALQLNRLACALRALDHLLLLARAGRICQRRRGGRRRDCCRRHRRRGRDVRAVVRRRLLRRD